MAALTVVTAASHSPLSADAGDTGASQRSVAATLSVGTNHACYVANGLVYCWGSNSQGQLGRDPNDLGDPVTRSAVPLVVPGLTNVTAVAAGGNHTCVLKSDTTVHCFGESGVWIGNNASGITYQPIQVTTGAASVTAGARHTCAVMTAGSVYCWGSGWNGELGNGGTGTSSIPVQALGTSDPALAVSAGYAHTCAVVQSGRVKCWGSNSSGQIGQGSVGTNVLTPGDVLLQSTSGALEGAVSVSAGFSHSCAVTLSGAAYCWGDNMYQELGTAETTSGSNPRAFPVRASSGSSATIS